MSPPQKLLLTPAVLLASLFAFCAGSVADEIVINRNATKVGDFDCSNCISQESSKLDLLNGNMTAGDLWREFDRQGINSVDRLTFYFALEQDADSNGFGLQPVEFKLDNVMASLDGNSLVVHNDGTDSSIPVAKLELSLPYDFMEKYSAESTSPVEFTAANSDEAASSKVSIGLLGFGAFWIIVFVLFNRLTKPNKSKPDSPALPSTSNRQVLSA